jgi:hypothetical protein
MAMVRIEVTAGCPKNHATAVVDVSAIRRARWEGASIRAPALMYGTVRDGASD